MGFLYVQWINSNKTHPRLHISTEKSYCFSARIISGGRYHLETMWVESSRWAFCLLSRWFIYAKATFSFFFFSLNFKLNSLKILSFDYGLLNFSVKVLLKSKFREFIVLKSIECFTSVVCSLLILLFAHIVLANPKSHILI
jgi:hypothetical protein